MAQAKTRSVPGVKDAISILAEDHRKVKKLFADFDKLMASSDKEEEKGALVEKICEGLTVHARLEEEIFYKAKKARLDLAALGAQMLERKQELQASGGTFAVKKRASVA